MTGAERLQRALRATQRQHTARHATRYGDVVTAAPLRIALESGEQLEADELALTAAVRDYARDPGLKSGDTLVLQPLDDDLVAVAVRPAPEP